MPLILDLENDENGLFYFPINLHIQSGGLLDTNFKTINHFSYLSKNAKLHIYQKHA
jgi:hypothetical protein